VIQAATADVWVPGDPVILIVSGGRTRVARALEAGQQPAPANYPAPGSYPVPSAYPNAPVTPVYPPSGPVPPRS
jgi:hypothetical protein